MGVITAARGSRLVAATATNPRARLVRPTGRRAGSVLGQVISLVLIEKGDDLRVLLTLEHDTLVS